MKVRILFLTVLTLACLFFNLSLRVPHQSVVQAQVEAWPRRSGNGRSTETK